MDTAFGDIKFTKTAKMLLAKLDNKEITLDQFLTDCAYWALRCGFDELMPKILPSRPDTEAFMEFERLSEVKRAKLDPKYFLDHPEINEYWAQRKQIEATNRHTLAWLNDMLVMIPEADRPIREKILERIRVFGAEAQAQADPEAERLADVFDGKVLTR
jgi:hypothetical protein